MKWLTVLSDYYSTSKVPAARVDMLLEVFGSEPDTIMEPAVKAYMMANEWFPQVAQLRPYVDTERVKHNDGIKRTRRDRFGRVRPVFEYSDDQILAWEQERGTMKSIDDIQDEIDAARSAMPNAVSFGDLSREMARMEVV